MARPIRNWTTGATKRRRLILWIALGTGLLSISAVWLFRVEVRPSDRFGETTFHYRWGGLSSVEIDVNGDGRRDGLFLLRRDAAIRDWEAHVVEGWESIACDSMADLYWYRDDTGTLVLEIDADGDGAFDERYRGDEARDVFSALDRSRCAAGDVR